MFRLDTTIVVAEMRCNPGCVLFVAIIGVLGSLLLDFPKFGWIWRRFTVWDGGAGFQESVVVERVSLWSLVADRFEGLQVCLVHDWAL